MGIETDIRLLAREAAREVVRDSQVDEDGGK